VLVEHTNELADLRETLQNVVTNRNHLQDQYTNQVEAGYNAYQLPPSVVTAPTSATASTTANSVAPSIVVYPDFESILQRALQTQAALTKKAIANSRRLIPKQHNTHRSSQRHSQGKTNNTTNSGAWRQWKYWCYTCGVNLKHKSDGCTQQRKDSNHYAFPNATKDNPQGGNNTGDDLWMQWCNPVTYKQHPTKGGSE